MKLSTTRLTPIHMDNNINWSENITKILFIDFVSPGKVLNFYVFYDLKSEIWNLKSEIWNRTHSNSTWKLHQIAMVHMHSSMPVPIGSFSDQKHNILSRRQVRWDSSMAAHVMEETLNLANKLALWSQNLVWAVKEPRVLWVHAPWFAPAVSSNYIYHQPFNITRSLDGVVCNTHRYLNGSEFNTCTYERSDSVFVSRFQLPN